MKNQQGLFRLGVVAVAVGRGFACWAQTPEPPPSAPQTPPTVNESPLPPTSPGGAMRVERIALSLKADKKVYRPGEPIKLTLTAKNTLKQPVTLRFNSGQKYDMEIRKGKKRGGERVWRWGEGRMFIQMVNAQTLEPGKAIVATETVASARTPDTSLKLAPGEYTAMVTLMTGGGRTPRPFASTVFKVK